MSFRPPPLSELAFSFARFVATEHRCSHFRCRTFSLAAHRRAFGRNFGHRQQHRINGGLRHRRAHAPRRRYGPGSGLRRRHNYRHDFHHVQHRHDPAGPSTTTVTPQEEALVLPEVVVVVPVATGAEVSAEKMVDTKHMDEASASNISADANALLPPPPAFSVPPMEWLLGGPSAGWLVDDPEREFSDDELETLPPMMRYFQRRDI